MLTVALAVTVRILGAIFREERNDRWNHWYGRDREEVLKMNYPKSGILNPKSIGSQAA